MIVQDIARQLPPAFFDWVPSLYQQLPYQPEESPEKVHALLALQTGHARMRMFLLPGQARLLGMVTPGSETALFGFWEGENDLESHAQLFATFEQWALEQGCNRLEGPKNFNTFHAYRLRISEPSWQQFNREPVNPPNYPALLQALGFEVLHHFESRKISTAVVPEVYGSKQQLVDSVQSLPFAFIPLTPASWQAHAAAIYELIGEIFCQNPGYQAVSQAEFELLYNAEYAAMLCPHSSVLLAERSSGRLVAISLCHPNYSPLKLSEPAVFEKHYPLLKHRTLLAKTQGVHPQFRQQGLMNYLGAYGMLSFRQFYDDIIFCLMRHDNPSLRFTDPFPYEKAAYAVYQKILGSMK